MSTKYEAPHCATSSILEKNMEIRLKEKKKGNHSWLSSIGARAEEKLTKDKLDSGGGSEAGAKQRIISSHGSERQLHPKSHNSLHAVACFTIISAL
jgi:hypothetical protein